MVPQQRDPLGPPLLFHLPLQPTLRFLHSQLKIGYLNDMTLGGSQEAVSNDLNKIIKLEASLGISLNRHKNANYTINLCLNDAFREFRLVEFSSLELLSAPLFKRATLD